MTSITRKQRLNRKLFASIACGMLICCCTLLLIIERKFAVKEKKVESNPEENEESVLESGDPKACYQRTTGRQDGEYEIRYLKDVLDADLKPNNGESIIFHETTCSKSGLVQLNSRQACAIESAAKLNPHRNVFVLFASPVGFRGNASNLPENIEILKSYPNVHLRNNNVWKYAEGTPLEKWLNTGTLFESKFLFEHMSDVLRYLTLYKFGGIFMDLDVVVQRNFDHLGQNFAGDDSADAIGCGVLHFGMDRVGRKVAQNCIRFMINNFNGKIFISNGPLVITRTLEKLCNTTKRTLMTREHCDGFQLYPRSTFYAVSWSTWTWFFNPDFTNHTLELTKNSTLIHVWNDMSKKTRVKIGEGTAYEVVANKNCPKTYFSRINYEYF